MKLCIVSVWQVLIEFQGKHAISELSQANNPAIHNLCHNQFHAEKQINLCIGYIFGMSMNCICVFWENH